MGGWVRENSRSVSPLLVPVFVFVSISIALLSSNTTKLDSLSQDLFLNEANVATVSGTSFGAWGEGFVRFSYANSAENIERAIDRIRKVL